MPDSVSRLVSMVRRAQTAGLMNLPSKAHVAWTHTRLHSTPIRRGGG